MGVPGSLRIAMCSGLETHAKLHWSTLSGAIFYLLSLYIHMWPSKKPALVADGHFVGGKSFATNLFSNCCRIS
jgi:hypothetical protein